MYNTRHLTAVYDKVNSKNLRTLLKKIDLNQFRDSHQEETSLFMMEALSGVETLSLPITLLPS